MQLKLYNCNIRLVFNHCTIINYRSHNIIKRCSKMGFHCDLKYDDKGNSIRWSNSQINNTPTVIVTFGDNRKLHWRRLEKHLKVMVR